jgi:hypothetical protein
MAPFLKTELLRDRLVALRLCRLAALSRSMGLILSQVDHGADTFYQVLLLKIVLVGIRGVGNGGPSTSIEASGEPSNFA